MKESPADEAVRQSVLENAGARLLKSVEGLENVADRMADLRADFKARTDAAKSEGYNAGAIKLVMKRRAATPETLAAQQQPLLGVDTYEQTLGVAE